MAKYVLIRFEDDDDIKDVELTLHVELGLTHKVMAIYKAPTIFCECATTAGVSIKQRGWGRGTRWGWWACSLCGRPSKSVSENVFFEDTQFGFNLLNKIEIPIVETIVPS